MADPTPRPRPWRERLSAARSRLARATPLAAGAAGALLTLLLVNLLAPARPPLTADQVRLLAAETLASATPPPARSALIYELIRPSLVLIQTQGPEGNGAAEQGLGSGVVVNADGAILTSLHVVAGAESIRLTFADGSESGAQVVNEVPENDIAVLMPTAPPAQVVPAMLGNPGAVQVGDEAFVVGNPLGLTWSLSAGVISGLDRSFRPPGAAQDLDGLIQIDAAVNPGNSGGPLLNRDGQVIGIVAGLVNPTDQEVFIGLGFAVPINVAGGAAGLPPY
jgi:S1-C subfamily serine protease